MDLGNPAGARRIGVLSLGLGTWIDFVRSIIGLFDLNRF
jgi:hypothetical protein